MEKKRLFLDMDGTLAMFHAEVDCLERMYEPGFFTELKPYTNLLQGVKRAVSSPEVEVFILSSVIDKDELYFGAEKNAWVDRYLPEVDGNHRIFIPVGNIKANYVPGGITGNDYLVDDYNLNLTEWEAAGGQSIKCHNDINHLGKYGPLWAGRMVHTSDLPEKISADLFSHMEIYDIQEPVEAKKISADFLLSCAMKTPDYFRIKSAIAGIPVDDMGNIFIPTLLEKTKGTDTYDAIVKICKENGVDLNDKAMNLLTEHSDNIRVEGHTGTWYVINTENIAGKDLYLLESEQYGDEAANLIVDGHGKLLLEDVYNGFDDYREHTHAEFEKLAAPGSTFSIYQLEEADRYSYEELREKALSTDATPEDVRRFGEWFEQYGRQYWNGECYNAGEDNNLYPIYRWDNDLDQGEIIGYTFDSSDQRYYEGQAADETGIDLCGEEPDKVPYRVTMQFPGKEPITQVTKAASCEELGQSLEIFKEFGADIQQVEQVDKQEDQQKRPFEFKKNHDEEWEL